jgi:hypothetical protein
MQSSETKTKRTRKTVEEKTTAAPASVAAAASEEPTKTRRRAVLKTQPAETTPSVKHRGAARKAAPAQPESVAVAAVADANGPVSRSIAQQEIAALAYSYWEARGFRGGSPEEDWLRAEQELRSR